MFGALRLWLTCYDWQIVWTFNPASFLWSSAKEELFFPPGDCHSQTLWLGTTRPNVYVYVQTIFSLYVNNYGKEIKIIIFFTKFASNRLTNRHTRKRNVSFIIIKLHYSITLPFGRFEQTTKKCIQGIPHVSPQKRFVANFVDFSRAKIQTLSVDLTGVFFRDTEMERDDLLFGSLIFHHNVRF